MSCPNAKKKLVEIFKKENPTVNFNRVNKDFAKSYTLTLLAMCEMWHRMRSHNQSVEIMVHSFAQTIVTKNKKERELVETIHLQRERLAQLEKLVADRKHAMSKQEVSG